MKIKLIVEKNDIKVKEIGIFATMAEVEHAMFSTSLTEDENFATVPLDADLYGEVEYDESAAECAERELDAEEQWGF